jgi:Ser/Thr protein kinase RdoA (MazF antagonist)
MAETPQTIADLGPPLAYGRTAELYAWQPGWLLKLFLPQYTMSGVQYEADVVRRVYATGLPIPAPGEIVTLEQRFGIPYERVDGVTMLSRLNDDPRQGDALIRQLGRLHAQVHTHAVTTLPLQKVRLAGKIEAADLPSALRSKALQVLADLPGEQRLCHGDFHPDNVLLTAGEPVIIDWNDATAGHPAADVARTLLLFRFGGMPEDPLARQAEQARRALLRGLYLAGYGGQPALDAGLIQQWLIPVTAGRLAENTTDRPADLVYYLEQLCRS